MVLLLGDGLDELVNTLGGVLERLRLAVLVWRISKTKVSLLTSIPM